MSDRANGLSGKANGLITLTSAIWYTSVLLVLVAGWSVRGERYLIAESGIGYWLGIIGGSMMLLLLLYPLRKRFVRWTAIGSVKSWFRIHMILGIVGPVAVIFHSGFQLGSFNSTIAFVCMLIVAVYVDLRHWIIPDEVSIYAVPVAIVAMIAVTVVPMSMPITRDSRCASEM